MQTQRSIVERGAEAVLPTYPARPIAFVRGRGTTLWTRTAPPTSTSSPASRSSRSATPTRRRSRRSPARRRARPRLEPVLDRARRGARRAAAGAVRARRRRVLLQLGCRGERGGDQARPPPRPGARRAGEAPHRLPRGLVPRPHARHAAGHLGAAEEGAFEPLPAGLRARAPERPRRARRSRRRHHRGDPARAGAGRGRRPPARARLPGAGARAVRPPRRAADLRRGADRHRPLRRVARQPPARRRAPTRSRWPRARVRASRSARS